ncbi:MAG: LysR family transcriptional regulator [Ilumatobacter sp.]|nr:LysR family transcriptional regulator [Ilumatobacter sp.]
MIDLRQLELKHVVALDAVASEGTFGRAAERLGYTQSAVSQQIAALERILGDKVFDRPGGPRPVVLTPLGAELLERGRELLARVDAMSLELDLFRTGSVGRLSVGTFQSTSAMLLPKIVGRMRDQFPSIEMHVVESDDEDRLVTALVTGEVEVSFLVGEPPADIDGLHLFDDPYVLVARPGQFDEGPVSVDQFADEPMIGQHPNACQLTGEAGLRSVGLTPTYVYRTNDNSTVAAMVRAGMGVAVMPFLCVEPEDRRVSIHPLEPSIPDRSIWVAWREHRTQSPAAQRFVDLAVDVSRQFAGQLRAIA